MQANFNVAHEKGANTKVLINSVTFVSKKFSEVVEFFQALLS